MFPVDLGFFRLLLWFYCLTVFLTSFFDHLGPADDDGEAPVTAVSSPHPGVVAPLLLQSHPRPAMSSLVTILSYIFPHTSNYKNTQFLHRPAPSVTKQARKARRWI